MLHMHVLKLASTTVKNEPRTGFEPVYLQLRLGQFCRFGKGKKKQLEMTIAEVETLLCLANVQKLVHLVTGYYLSLGKISEVVVLISNRLVKLVTHLGYYFNQ